MLLSVPAAPNESYESEMSNMEPPRSEFKILRKNIIDAILFGLGELKFKFLQRNFRRYVMIKIKKTNISSYRLDVVNNLLR